MTDFYVCGIAQSVLVVLGFARSVFKETELLVLAIAPADLVLLSLAHDDIMLPQNRLIAISTA